MALRSKVVLDAHGQRSIVVVSVAEEDAQAATIYRSSRKSKRKIVEGRAAFRIG